jgi:hypothetical protein
MYIDPLRERREPEHILEFSFNRAISMVQSIAIL